MTRRARAMWRLARCVAHGLHGLTIVRLRFGSLDDAQRAGQIRWWSTKMLRLIGVGLSVEGGPPTGGALLVANHVSWLDVLALHAVLPHARFVSKADVKAWPLLSQLVAAGGTLYLERERKRDALRVVHQMAEHLGAGATIAVFPEGTTSDGRRLLPFHANLMQAAIASATPVQPVALRFSDATDACSVAVEFVGATTLATSLWRVANAEGLIANIAWLTPRETSAQTDRRALASTLRDDIAAHLTRCGADAMPSGG